MRSAGVIGGLGPETTAEFYLDVIFSCQKQDRSSRPPIIIASVPLPYQIEEDAIAKNTGIERCLPFLISEARRLEESGADFIVMPCNSLHVFIEQIRDTVSIPVLSIVEETVAFLHSHDFKKVGIISTSATLRNKLYDDAFSANDILCETPDDFQQEKMGKIIHNLVNGQHNNKDREELIHIIDSFELKNVDCVVLACTDLQILIPKHQNLKVFDTMKILADSTVRKILEIEQPHKSV